MRPLNYFMAEEYLEPRCPSCQQRIDYGVTTRFDENLQGHVCSHCGSGV